MKAQTPAAAVADWRLLENYCDYERDRSRMPNVNPVLLRLRKEVNRSFHSRCAESPTLRLRHAGAQESDCQLRRDPGMACSQLVRPGIQTGIGHKEMRSSSPASLIFLAAVAWAGRITPCPWILLLGDRRGRAGSRGVAWGRSVTTTRLKLKNGRILKIRKPSLPDAEQQRVYDILGIDWKHAFPPIKSALPA